MVIACEEKIILDYSHVLEMHYEALRLDDCFKEWGGHMRPVDSNTQVGVLSGEEK